MCGCGTAAVIIGADFLKAEAQVAADRYQVTVVARIPDFFCSVFYSVAYACFGQTFGYTPLAKLRFYPQSVHYPAFVFEVYYAMTCKFATCISGKIGVRLQWGNLFYLAVRVECCKAGPPLFVFCGDFFNLYLIYTLHIEIIQQYRQLAIGLKPHCGLGLNSSYLWGQCFLPAVILTGTVKYLRL